MFDVELKKAIEAVSTACRLCQDVRRGLAEENVLGKEDRSPVTVADFGSQAVICHMLDAAFPADPVVAEEDAAQLRQDATVAGLVCKHVHTFAPALTDEAVFKAIDRGGAVDAGERFWTCDPIDGTKGFIRGDQYAIALALIENGVPVLGVLGCPNLPYPTLTGKEGVGVIQYAIVGNGAFSMPLNGGPVTRVNVSDVDDPARAAVCESVESGHTRHGTSSRIAELLGVACEPVRIDSQCKYAAVARGEASIYLRLPTRPGYEEKIWDHAAGWAILTAAGGTITDVTGKALDFSLGRTLRDNRGVIATNGHIHAKVLEAVAEVMG